MNHMDTTLWATFLPAHLQVEITDFRLGGNDLRMSNLEGNSCECRISINHIHGLKKKFNSSNNCIGVRAELITQRVKYICSNSRRLSMYRIVMTN